LRSDRLEDAVPVVPHRRDALLRHLDGETFARLIAGLDASTPRGRRDRAIMLLMARLGLRSGEVTALTLEDVDWRKRHNSGAAAQDRPRGAATAAARGR
jgi:integrase